MVSARVARGRKTQELAAEYLRDIYPNAEAVSASLPGKDIKNTPGVSIEIKATSQADITGALRQAVRNSEGDEIALVVYRPKGYGPERIDEWVVAMPFAYAHRLLDWYQDNPVIVRELPA